MYSLFIFYILATVIILVQCQEYDHKETGHHQFDEADCSDAALKEIRTNRMKAGLKARERHVTLIPHPGFVYNPLTVSVKRCNGFCAGRWSPMPSKSMMKEFVVHRHPEGDSMKKKCVRVKVEEHMTCRCMCMRSWKDCTELQDWDEPNCACPCKNMEVEKPKCIKAGHGWDLDKCACLHS